MALRVITCLLLLTHSTEKENNLKEMICTGAGLVGSFIAGLFGGWDAGLTTLVICMAIDYATGLLCAGVFHKSQKSANGALESKACFKGLVRKCVILLLVLVAHRLDLALGASYVRDGVCIAFTVSEVISIAENAGLMGVPLPAVLERALEALKDKANPKD